MNRCIKPADNQASCNSTQLQESLKIQMDSENSCNSSRKQSSSVLQTDENGVSNDEKVTCLRSVTPRSAIISNGTSTTYSDATNSKNISDSPVDAKLPDDELNNCVTSDVRFASNNSKSEKAKSPLHAFDESKCDIETGNCSLNNIESSIEKNHGEKELAKVVIPVQSKSENQQTSAITNTVDKHQIQHNVKSNDSGQKLKTETKPEVKSDNFRPLGKLLHDLGLELVREQVYRDLIEIQAAKEANNKLEEREKSQLVKLVEAQERLASRNSAYCLPLLHCSQCKFVSSSINAMVLHCQYGTVSRADPAAHVCCACAKGHGFTTRSASSFLSHLSEEHHIRGRLSKKLANFSCTNCPYEHRNLARIQTHMAKCLKKYPLICNLQPLPGDCDIALVYRPGDRGRPAKQLTNRPWSAPSVPGQPSVRTLLNTMRSQQTTASSTDTVLSSPVNLSTSSISSLICEICGKVVDGRESLWSHFRMAHHVELSKATMKDQDPWMKCDVCNGRFWTYQGLSRHLLLAHNRAIAAAYPSGNASSSVSASTPSVPVSARCHLCGGNQTANPLSHFSAYHNITLLEMYHAKLCCLCNRKLNSGRGFEEHMVLQHSDIFANYDVLRTVLQALTTARYFKSDDSRRASPASQSIGHVSNDARSTGHVKNNTHPSGHAKSNAASASLSPGHTRMNKRKKEVATTSERTTTTPVKTPEKPISAEEVKKLYEDLADIGRPILRSMRHKLNAVTVSSSAEDNSKITSTAPAKVVADDDIPPKKACLDESVSETL